MRFLLIFPLFLGFCQGDETLAAYGASDRVWVLQEMNGASVDVSATIRFADDGAVSGDGPCNAFTARQLAPYPWFEVGEIASTKRACPELALEQDYFTALKAATISEVSGDILILSNDVGEKMTFRAQ